MPTGFTVLPKHEGAGEHSDLKTFPLKKQKQKKKTFPLPGLRWGQNSGCGHH